jgi:glycogen operon protein
MFNAYWEPLTFELPRGDARPYQWRRCIDTALPPPDDSCTLDEAPPVTDGTYRVQSRSCVVLVSPLPQGATGAAHAE